MKWKTLFFAFFLVTISATISIATTPVTTSCSKIINYFDLCNLLLDTEFTPTGGGDPLPGGGIPT